MASLFQSSQMTLRSRLRDATQPIHSRLEGHFEQLGPTRGLDEYRSLLVRLLGFYRPVEQTLDRLDWSDSGIDLAVRSKTDWLQTDLRDLGFDAHFIGNCARCLHTPEATTIHDGLGIFYVLEGATLGGRLILERLGATLGIGSLHGGRFFAGYGRETALMWRGYLEILERYGSQPAVADAVERSAVATFLAYEKWMASQAGAVAETKSAASPGQRFLRSRLND